MVDLILLGTGGGLPTPDRNLSSLFINYKGRKILVDCGEGTQVSMKIAGTGFKNIDIICITHIHGDHIVGLPGLLGTIGNSGREEALTIIGPEGIAKAVSGLRTIAEYLPYEINIIEAPEKDLILFNGEVKLSTLPVEHSSPCNAYSFYFKRSPKFDMKKALKNKVPKVLWNKLQKTKAIIRHKGVEYTSSMILGDERKGIKLSFVTDTRPIEEIVEFIEDSDLFICEGTYGSDDAQANAIKNKHMTFREAATLAKDGKVKSLILTHFSPVIANPMDYLQNATEIFENTTIGTDRLEVTLKYDE